MPRKKKTTTRTAKKKPARGQRAKAAAAKAARLLGRRRAPEPAEAAPAVEARAVARYVRLSPQKARLVIDLIRGQDAGDALSTLRFTKRRAARPIEKVLRSAIANAEQKSETVDVDQLYVKHAVINEGPRLKRIRPAPQGRAYMYFHRMCHIDVTVAERGRPGALAPAAAEGSAPAAQEAAG
ncbi:MAG: 50S ribosomal protein L22 [Terriglobia bacterium]